MSTDIATTRQRTSVPAEKLTRAIAAFGVVGLPASVVERLRWHSSTPEYSELGWKIVHVALDVCTDEGGILPAEDVKRAIAVVEAATQPGLPADCLMATARLRSVARYRASVEDDQRLALTVYGEKMARYPADVVKAACEKWLETSPFWPSVSELLQACEWAMQPRRALLMKLREAAKDIDDGNIDSGGRQARLEARIDFLNNRAAPLTPEQRQAREEALIELRFLRPGQAA